VPSTRCLSISPSKLQPWLMTMQMLEWLDMISTSWRQPGERFANVSGMDSDYQLSKFPIAGLVQMALLLPSLLPKWNNMERAVLFSLVVTWKFTRSRWIILDSFMLRQEWTNFLMLFSPLIKQDWDPGTLSLDCDHPSTWPEKLLPSTENT